MGTVSTKTGFSAFIKRSAAMPFVILAGAVVAFFASAGTYITDLVLGAGYSILLLCKSALYLVKVPKRRRFIMDQMFITGVKPLMVVLVVALFTGMILALQIGIELEKFGQKNMIASIIGTALCREMGPFMTALILSACVGSGMAAEIGTMKVSEEIEALEVMSIRPEDILVMPRILALAVMCVVLTFICDVVGMAGGALVGKMQFDISYSLYYNNVVDALSDEEIVNLPKDIYTGLVKALVFGIMIATIGCSCGLRAAGGALGVGRATRTAVINSFVLIVITGYYMTYLFFRVLGE